MERYRQRENKEVQCSSAAGKTTLRGAYSKKGRTKSESDLLANLSFNKGCTVRPREIVAQGKKRWSTKEE